MEFTRRSLEIGPIELFGLELNPTLHWYGVIIVLAIIAGATLVAWLARRDDEDPEIVWNAVIWVIITGVIGARLWSVFFPAGNAGEGRALSLDYLTDLDNGPLAIWSGGLSIFGAVLGGLFGAYIYARKHQLDKLEWFDRAIISLPLAQAIGRWGNYINEELYGEPTDLPWGIQITNPIAPYTPDERFHPLFLYESLLNVALLGLMLYLWLWRRRGFQRGDFLLIYFIGYSLIRFVLEFIRIEIPEVGGVNVSQLTTFLLGSGALMIFVFRHRLDTITLQAEPYETLPRPEAYDDNSDDEQSNSEREKKPRRKRKQSGESIHKSGQFRGVRKSRKKRKKR